MIKKMTLEEKKIELYQEFRRYINMPTTEQENYKKEIELQANQRSEAEKEVFLEAIKSNVQEIKEKLLEINAKIDRNRAVSAK